MGYHGFTIWGLLDFKVNFRDLLYHYPGFIPMSLQTRGPSHSPGVDSEPNHLTHGILLRFYMLVIGLLLIGILFAHMLRNYIMNCFKAIR